MASRTCGLSRPAVPGSGALSPVRRALRDRCFRRFGGLGPDPPSLGYTFFSPVEAARRLSRTFSRSVMLGEIGFRRGNGGRRRPTDCPATSSGLPPFNGRLYGSDRCGTRRAGRHGWLSSSRSRSPCRNPPEQPGRVGLTVPGVGINRRQRCVAKNTPDHDDGDRHAPDGFPAGGSRLVALLLGGRRGFLFLSPGLLMRRNPHQTRS